jgi:hypothetical protein
VVDPSGVPLSMVEVVAFVEIEPASEGAGVRNSREIQRVIQNAGGTGNATAKTDERGEYSLAHLPSGRFRIVARATGYEVAEAAGLEPGDAVPDLVLVPFAGVSGRVTDFATGLPVTRFQVELVRESQGERSFTIGWLEQRSESFANEEGRYSLDDLPARDYSLKVSADGYAPALRKVRLDPGSDARVDVALSAGARIVGSARSTRDGAPVAGARIQLLPAGELRDPALYEVYARSVLTQVDGTFEVDGLPDGEYTLRVSHEDYYPASAARDIRFALPSEAPLVFDLELHPAGKVRGTIRGLAPPAGREYRIVQLHRLDEERGDAPAAEQGVPRDFSAGVGGDASFLVGGLPPGTYRVELTRHPMPTAEGPPPPPESHPLGTVSVQVGEATEFAADASE